MFKKNLISIFRNILKRKVSAAVIISSLGVGLSIAIVLFALIENENGTDAFHKHKDSIFRVLSSDPFEEGKRMAYIPKPASEYIEMNSPEVQEMCRVSDLNGDGITLENKTNSFENTMVVAVDSSFFTCFDWEFIQGGASASPLQPDGIIMSEHLAQKIYGQVNVVGQEVTVNFDTLRLTFYVTAVMKDLVENTHFKFDAIVPFFQFEKYLRGSSTYLLLDPKASPGELAGRLTGDKQMPSLVGPGKCQYFLESLPEVYFDKDNVRKFTKARDHNFIWIMWVIVFLILLIGVFNFVNLFVISLVERNKEFGVKKIQGATLIDIRLSLITEAVIYLASGLFLAMVLTIIFLPYFNVIFEANLRLAYFINSKFLLKVLGLLLLLTVALSYVFSLFVGRINPISLLNNRYQISFKFNRIFFVTQFVISMTLILCSLVIIKQVNYIKNKPLGFSRSIIELRLPKGGAKSDLTILAKKLDQESRLNAICVASGNPISSNAVIKFEINETESYSPYYIEGDENLISTLGLKLVAGNSFSLASGSDKIVNQKFIDYFSINDPIGALIPGSRDRIVGVVADFNVSSLKQEIPLYMIGYKSEGSRVLVNYTGLEPDEARSIVEKTWSQVFPNSVFTYAFLSEELLKKHKEDFYFSNIVVTFALVSIVISCFGLFALAQNNCQKKGKQIAIRKCLGASNESIMSLLVFDFGKLILLSFAIASMAGYFAVQKWLETFVYRTNITGVEFLITALITGFIALLSVSIQTIKAARVNPIRDLRYE